MRARTARRSAPVAALVPAAALVLAAGLAGRATPAGEAPAIFRPMFKESPDQAKVVTATFLGGKGHEWLVSGGFQPDGSVVLVGNVLGPTLEAGAPVHVIGADAAPPAEPEAPKVALGDRGRLFPVWNLPAVTGFVVKCAPDLKKIVSIHRLPWTSGAITAAVVDSTGALYVAGVATEQTKNLGGRQEPVRLAAPDPKSACDQTFLAKIAGDLAKCEWTMVLQGPSNPPQLRLLKDGALWLAAQDVRRVDPSGKVLSSAVVPGGVGRSRAASPVDGMIARNTNRMNWTTGREPWKCPGIRICRPDGSDLYHIYEWDGRYVGLDNHRSVADTHIMNLSYDYDGNLLLTTWSDGGNTVMRYGSHDIRRNHGFRGMGFQRGMTGYNVVRLDGRDYNTVSSTLWQCEGGGGLMRLQSLLPVSDGSILIAGSGGPKGIHQTVTTLLPEAPPQGSFVTVLSGSLTIARFSSLVGGAGEVDLGNSLAWGAACGEVQGQRKMLLVSGAKQESEPIVHAPEVLKTPTRSAMQSAFGGGALDGYAILLDLPPSNPQADAMPPVKYQRQTLEARAAARRRTEPAVPAEGTVYYFLADYPRHVNADAEFRDAGDTQILYEPMKGQPPASEPVVKDGLSISVRPSRPTFGLGEEMEFGLTLSNVGDKPIQVPAMNWEMRLEDGWQCRRTGAAPAAAAPAMELAAGKSQTARLRLARGAFEFSSPDGKPAPRLPLGVYRALLVLGQTATKTVEFRVAPYWPNFMYGKSVSGEMKWQGGKLTGSATVACTHWVQVQGDQSRRVLGELLQGKTPDAFPPVRFTLSDLGEMKTLETKSVDAQGKELVKSVRYAEGKGKLDFAGRSLDVATRSILNFSTTMPDNGKPGVGLETFFTVKGRELGLVSLADDEVDVRIGMRGTLEKSEPPKAGGK